MTATHTDAIPDDILIAAKTAVAEMPARPPFKCDVEAVVARAILAERERSRWMPIETAPKDGRRVIIRRIPRPPIKHIVVIGRWEGRSWRLDDGNRMPETGVSHWQPLPNPNSARGFSSAEQAAEACLLPASVAAKSGSVQHVGVSPSAIVGSNPLAAREADESAAPITGAK